MHPVKIDELLQQTDNTTTPIKHDDSPFVWISTENIDDQWHIMLYYHSSSFRHMRLTNAFTSGNSNIDQYLQQEILLLRWSLQQNPDWKP